MIIRFGTLCVGVCENRNRATGLVPVGQAVAALKAGSGGAIYPIIKQPSRIG